jgi:hypothetical protein
MTSSANLNHVSFRHLDRVGVDLRLVGGDDAVTLDDVTQDGVAGKLLVAVLSRAAKPSGICTKNV